MKYRFSRGMLAALIAGITFFYPLLAPTPHRIDEAHFKLIENGMSLAQVEAIFGVPPGEYDWAEVDIEDLLTFYSRLNNQTDYVTVRWAVPIQRVDLRRQKSWTSCNGCVNVYFDEEERVVGTSHWPTVRAVSPWDRAKRWWKSK